MFRSSVKETKQCSQRNKALENKKEQIKGNFEKSGKELQLAWENQCFHLFCSIMVSEEPG